MVEPKNKLTSAKAEHAKQRSAEQRALDAARRRRWLWWGLAVIVIAAGVAVVVAVF